MEQDQSKVLLVEGAGDEGVIKEILDAWNVPCPCIKACGSDAQVFQALKLMVESESAISNIESKGLQQYTPRHRPKAKIHTYLAWQKDPGSTLPQAIQKHYLDVSSENARPFVSWISRLFWEKQAN